MTQVVDDRKRGVVLCRIVPVRQVRILGFSEGGPSCVGQSSQYSNTLNAMSPAHLPGCVLRSRRNVSLTLCLCDLPPRGSLDTTDPALAPETLVAQKRRSRVGPADTVSYQTRCLESWPLLTHLVLNHFSFDWSFGSMLPKPLRLLACLETLKMQMDEISDSNHLCECLVIASAASLRHLRLDPDDATSEFYVRMFTAVAGTLVSLDCRGPGDHRNVLADGLRVRTSLKQLTLSIEAFAHQVILCR
jgi:hypothetical protein